MGVSISAVAGLSISVVAALVASLATLLGAFLQGFVQGFAKRRGQSGQEERAAESEQQVREREIQNARAGVEAAAKALANITEVLGKLETDINDRARIRAELDDAIKKDREVAEVTQAQADALTNEVLAKLVPRDQKTFRSGIWVSILVGGVFFVGGIVVTHLFG